MRSDFTDVTMVVDRSGSMEQIRSDAEGGINAFVVEQAKLPGECRITLVQFDTEYEFVHRGILASEWTRYQLVPRGSTALLDAVGRAIIETGTRISAMPESERPGLVVFVITTDGMENASREFNVAKVKQMIAHQQTKYNWKFNFLAANQEAFGQARDLGINLGGAAVWGEGKTGNAHATYGQMLGRMRSAASKGEKVENLFTDEERKQME